jgi:hypothetical protein
VNASLADCINHDLTKLVYTFGGIEEIECYPQGLPRSVAVKIRWPNGKVYKTYTFQGYCKRTIEDYVQFEIVPDTMTMNYV